MPDNDSFKKDISVCSFNCRSFKNSVHAIYKLCDKHDIVLLQEHWLLPFDLQLLNTAHNDFISIGLSAVDTSTDILVGRPYGGTAILYRKCLADKINIVVTDESRITSIRIITNVGPLLVLNVYMPTNYNDDSSLESYIDCLSKLHVLIVESDAIHTLIVGDFNCSPGSRFFSEFASFATDNNLITTDLYKLHDVVTYISDDGSKMSWVDHIMSSVAVDNMINNICILNDVIVSDHKPVSFIMEGIHISHDSSPIAVNNNSVCSTPTWNNCDDTTLSYYSSYLDRLLQCVCIPLDAVFNTSSDETFFVKIDKFYADICNCIVKATGEVIPKRTRTVSDFNVPGWNTYVAEKHEVARNTYMAWLDFGKPKFGHYFDDMKRTRALFKLALRYCKNHIEEMKADACAESLYDKDCRKFWNCVYKISNNKASSHVDTVGGVNGPHNVANLWKDHFEKLYNSSSGANRHIFEEKVKAFAFHDLTPVLTVMDIADTMNKQKRGKSPGPDGIYMEAFIYGGHRLHLYLSILFNLFLTHGYVPDAFHRSTIIPLVKNKSGNLSDVNNYRAIALSNSITKILESLLHSFLDSRDTADDYQFGFKKNHSTSFCTYVFKKTVNYYRQNGSHVFACFIDFNKAFDNVDYWLLFSKLIDDNPSILCLAATRLLAFWYSNQQMFVRWQNISSQYFNIANGVRQGGILSPFLFRFYIRDLIDKVTSVNLGCSYAGTVINLLAFADDMVLLAPSWHALQTLLLAVEDAADKISMSFNTKKTVCMVFNPLMRCKLVCVSFPEFTLAGSKLKFVDSFRYLGHIIDNYLCDDQDINREIKALFTRTNILSRRFKRCSVQVKLRLFKAFCICFYDAALWVNFSNGAISKLSSAYNKSMKSFFGFHKFSSVTGMLLSLGLPSFTTLVHNYRVGFTSRIVNCCNNIVQCINSII